MQTHSFAFACSFLFGHIQLREHTLTPACPCDSRGIVPIQAASEERDALSCKHSSAKDADTRGACVKTRQSAQRTSSQQDPAQECMLQVSGRPHRGEIPRHRSDVVLQGDLPAVLSRMLEGNGPFLVRTLCACCDGSLASFDGFVDAAAAEQRAIVRWRHLALRLMGLAAIRAYFASYRHICQYFKTVAKTHRQIPETAEHSRGIGQQPPRSPRSAGYTV